MRDRANQASTIGWLLAVAACIGALPVGPAVAGSCPGAGGCCEANGTPGCDDVTCCEEICAADPFCCDTEWDGICADAANGQCLVCEGAQACCFDGGSCIDTDPIACQSSFGFPQGEGTTCAADGCTCPGEGDCCEANGTPGCSDATCCSSVCAADSFCCETEWDQLCADQAAQLCSVCQLGACCLGGGECFVTDPLTCLFSLGSYGGPGSMCSQQFCPTPACCFPDGSCAPIVEFDCPLFGGEPQGPGSTCSPNPCVADCCDGSETPEGEPCGSDTNGGCDTPAGFTPATCGDVFCGTAWAAGGQRDTDWYRVTLEQGGSLSATLESQFSGTVLILAGLSICQPFLVGDATSVDCAAGTASAVDLAPADYAVFVAVAAFDGVPCNGGHTQYRLAIAGDCAAACCFPDGSCQLLAPPACSAAGGAPQGQGSACSPGLCPSVLEACCFPDGSCADQPFESCLATGGQAQGPSTSCSVNSYALASCPGAFEDISGSGIEAPNASNVDDAGDVVPLGFTFEFFGNAYDTVGVCSNGYLTFGSTLSDFTNDPIPDAMEPNDLIAPLWDDWSPNQGGTVHYQTLGPAGDRRFIAQWTNVVHFNTGGPATFQVVLYEDFFGCVEFRYGDVLELDTPSVGVEDADGFLGSSVALVSITPGACVSLCPQAYCPAPPGCPADTNFDGVVDVADLVNVVLSWGPCPGGPCPGDVDGSGTVDVNDLVTVVLSWGACP